MNQLNQQLLTSLSAQELAKELRDHEDPIVRHYFQMCDDDYDQRIEDLESQVNSLDADIEQLAEECKESDRLLVIANTKIKRAIREITELLQKNIFAPASTQREILTELLAELEES